MDDNNDGVPEPPLTQKNVDELTEEDVRRMRFGVGQFPKLTLFLNTSNDPYPTTPRLLRLELRRQQCLEGTSIKPFCPTNSQAKR